MEIQTLEYGLTVCKVASEAEIDLTKPFYFIGKTGEELSLVCPTQDAPLHTTAREDGWNGFRIQGVLDFSLVGILAKIAALLAQEQISIFAVSTYNTDYILVKQEDFGRALKRLAEEGYQIT